MKIETVALEDQQTRITAEFDAEVMEKYKHKAARKISRTTKIPGFRPGKAPFDLIRRMVGDEALVQEAVEIMLDEVYPQILTEAAISPSGPGKLEEIVSMDPPRFSFVVPLAPVVELGDYKSLRKEYAPEPITDEQVEKTILRLRRSYATVEPAERAAETGDQVTFKMSAKRSDPAEGEEETLLEEGSYQMVAGEQDENEEDWPYEGFTDVLVGMSAGDTKTIEHTFPEDSRYEELRGKTASYTVTVENVKAMTLPELNDEFAQGLGEFENVEALRTAIRQQLEQNYSQQYDQNYYEDLIDMLVSQATVKYPPHMLDEEVEQFVHNVEHSLEHDRLDLETYLKMREMNRETFIEQEVKPAATKRLVRSLVLEEFARAENVEVKNFEIQSVYEAALKQLQQSKELRRTQARSQQSPREMANSLAINTVNSIFNQRLTARLRAIAQGKGDEVPPALDLTATPIQDLLGSPAAEAGDAVEAGDTVVSTDSVEVTDAVEPASTVVDTALDEASQAEPETTTVETSVSAEPPVENTATDPAEPEEPQQES